MYMNLNSTVNNNIPGDKCHLIITFWGFFGDLSLHFGHFLGIFQTVIWGFFGDFSH